MSQSVQMPALGESVTEGTVTQWLKSVGDTVEVDEPLLEVSTDKVDTEVPSPVAGVLEKILVEEDETVEVGADLAVIGSGEESSDSGSDSGEQSEPEDAPAAESSDQAQAEEDEPAPTQESPQASAEDSEDSEDAAEESSSEQASSGSDDGERTAVTLPALGESVTEGTVTQWLKSVGDTVEVDEPLLEVSTDKVDTEVPSPVAGTLLEVVVSEDETVEVGGTLAYVGSGQPASASEGQPEEKAEQKSEPEPKAEEKAEPEPEPEPQEEAEPQEKSEPEPQEKPQPRAEQAPESKADEKQGPGEEGGSRDSGTPYVTPLVRKLAADKGVELSSLTGTGVGGRVRKQDVLDAAEKAAAPSESAPTEQASSEQSEGQRSQAPAPKVEVSPLRGTTEKMSRLRKIVAQRMVESLHTSAQLTTVVEVDVTKVARLRARAKDDFQAREGVKLTFLPFFTLAATEALKQFPKLNASIDGDEVIYHGSENVGIAVDTERGLLVPVIKDAGDLNIAGIARKISDLAARTRDNKATPDELGGGTFTITNTGSGGALFDTPILLQPQVGILGVGTIVKRPVVVSDADGAEVIAIRSMVYLALSYDHRLVDGADAARFLTAMKGRLEEGRFESALGL
ncbi:2-oxoglutarate dehydrogenase, E2 component, dihydrolipoamide succinyltransferase [Ruania suaedae]|uniref:2-oxoglutarate dehydrogenase, E2 component, dihydrolipoamide succinyltransferase n=1 Tax=Ruania suaedae TaxID=2897774 RepID=UPI001E38068F|nr:2-oxoglutarate dehydrogenase, E2 component, dihydrolipoamide succinyltransferase [Ruania suaedae]UFU01657.1 2-oxoglutarate dehydrogenase, E2 component, dihydrolipoamide succinyltransferase [Ruania suaedae]